MAYDLSKLTKLLHIKSLAEKIQETFVPKSDYVNLNHQVQSMNANLLGMSSYLNDIENRMSSIADGKITAALTTVYKPKGSKTFDQLLSALQNAHLSSGAANGEVYNLTEAFTTTDVFIEGAGKEYPAGTNVVIIYLGGDNYKFDVLSGFIDLSGYVANGKIATDAEVEEMLDELFTA